MSNKRSRRSFLASIAIHLAAFIAVNLNFFPPFQQLKPSSPIKNEVEVKFVEALFPSNPEESSLQSITIKTIKRGRINSTSHLTKPIAYKTKNRDAYTSLEQTSVYKQVSTAMKMPTYSKAPPSFDASLALTAPSQIDLEFSKSLEESLEQNKELLKNESNGSDNSNADDSNGSNGSGEMNESSDKIGRIGSAMNKFAGHIASESRNKKCDLVFLLDTSGSMDDNIEAVEKNLDSMVDIFSKEKIDYLFTVVKFKYNSMIYPTTKDVEKLKRLLKYKMRVGGDEMAYDAIFKAAHRIEFRPDANRYFIVVTDESFKGTHSYIDVLKLCIGSQIHVNVLGTDDLFQQWLAERTGGIWIKIPE